MIKWLWIWIKSEEIIFKIEDIRFKKLIYYLNEIWEGYGKDKDIYDIYFC